MKFCDFWDCAAAPVRLAGLLGDSMANFLLTGDVADILSMAEHFVKAFKSVEARGID